MEKPLTPRNGSGKGEGVQQEEGRQSSKSARTIAANPATSEACFALFSRIRTLIGKEGTQASAVEAFQTHFSPRSCGVFQDEGVGAKEGKGEGPVFG